MRDIRGPRIPIFTYEHLIVSTIVHLPNHVFSINPGIIIQIAVVGDLNDLGFSDIVGKYFPIRSIQSLPDNVAAGYLWARVVVVIDGDLCCPVITIIEDFVVRTIGPLPDDIVTGNLWIDIVIAVVCQLGSSFTIIQEYLIVVSIRAMPDNSAA